MNIIESIRSALDALRANLLRSALTMLGMIIGVAAVIATVAVGAGARAVVLEQIRALGSNLMIVLPGNIIASGVRLGTGARASLTQDDAAAIERELPEIQTTAATVRGGVQVVAGNLNWATTLIGVSAGFLEAREWDVAAGREIMPEEYDRGATVLLIGETVARTLYGDADPVGSVVRVRNVPFTIVGALARKGQTTGGQDQDDVVMVPLRAAQRRVLGINRANARAVGAIVVKVQGGEEMSEAEERVRELLRQRHRLSANQEDDFSLRNLSEIAATRDASARTLAVLLGTIAAVSLLVGGIGIMNIMLVSVSERTREIGLRLAVGARPRDIRAQFLIEAMTLAIIGGAIGVVFGIISARVVSTLAGWPTLIDPMVVAISVGVSALVGVFFGLYPAERAANLDPIEALRRE